MNVNVKNVIILHCKTVDFEAFLCENTFLSSQLCCCCPVPTHPLPPPPPPSFTLPFSFSCLLHEEVIWPSLCEAKKEGNCDGKSFNAYPLLSVTFPFLPF